MSLEGPIQAAFPTVGELGAPGLSSRLTETSTWGLLIINRWSSAQTNQESARSRRARCAQGDGRTHWNSPRPLTPLHTAGGAHLFSGACITGLSAARTAAWLAVPAPPFSGFIRAQFTRIVRRALTGQAPRTPKGAPSNAFARRYTPADLDALADVERKYGRLFEPETVAVLRSIHPSHRAHQDPPRSPCRLSEDGPTINK